MYDRAYLIGIIYSFGLLVLFAISAPRRRKFIIWSALLWAPAAPILEYWHHQDYWNPTYLIPMQIGNWRFGLEDYLFGLAFTGICTGLFDLLAVKSDQKATVRFCVSGSAMLLSVSIVIIPTGMFILSTLLGFNSIYALVIIGFCGSTIALFRRPDWITPAFQTAILMGISLWVSYTVFYLKLYPGIIDHWWHKNISAGLSIGGVPFEELLWAIMSGLFIGPVSRHLLIMRDR